MTTGIENKLLCLSLNSLWQPIDQKTVRESICSLVSGDFVALDINYSRAGEEYDFSTPIELSPVDWQKWITLPVRPFDFSISSTRLTVRVPTVIVAKNFSKMPLKKMRLSIENVRSRDKNTCQYTGRKLKDGEGNVDHVIPKFLGGTESWENLVFCDKKINARKGRSSINEMGLKLIREPQEPPMIPALFLFRSSKHRDWAHFFI
jgi:5-methylcytosine-specific restriction endonuclease McrA